MMKTESYCELCETEDKADDSAGHENDGQLL